LQGGFAQRNATGLLVLKKIENEGKYWPDISWFRPFPGMTRPCVERRAWIRGDLYRLSRADWKDANQMRKRNSRRSRLSQNGSPAAPEVLETRVLLAGKGGPEFVAGELLVQYNAGTTTAGRNAARAGMGLQVAETIQTKSMQTAGFGVMERVRVGNGMTMEAAMARLKANARVKFVEPNYIYKPSAVSDDTYYTNGSLWGMYGSDSPGASGPAGTTNQACRSITRILLQMSGQTPVKWPTTASTMTVMGTLTTPADGTLSPTTKRFMTLARIHMAPMLPARSEALVAMPVVSWV